MSEQLGRLSAALAGRYDVTRELGSGGMATVYLAEDLKHSRNVAIKVLKPELASALGPERFLREIELAAGLDHPHILPLYDSGEADEHIAAFGLSTDPVCWMQTAYATGYTSQLFGKLVLFREVECRGMGAANCRL